MVTRYSAPHYKNFSNRTEHDLSHPGNYEFNAEAIIGGCVGKGIMSGVN